VIAQCNWLGHSFLWVALHQIVLVTMYAKNVRDNIEPAVLKRLKDAYQNG